jgi:hypothetical protein
MIPGMARPAANQPPGACQFPLADDLNCGAPTPRRAAFCDFHEGVAAIQRKADVSNKAGELLAKNPKAKGTRGQLAGKDSSGGVRAQPPEDDADTPTLDEMGITKTQVEILRDGSPELIAAVECGVANHSNS